MADVVSDLSEAFGAAVNSDPVMTLLPLAIVGIASGLRAGGIGQALAMATRGLFWLGGLVFAMHTGEAMMEAGASVDTLSGSFDRVWNDLMGLRFVEVLGFWLLLLAATMLILVIRTFVRR
ncbi:hypothetical protein HK107_04410 [Parvularcula sp. ZS-1/3]|uniref:Uncharacterized protein n=1 Tax=Parvularcula mediterranea TaxID=2732508 RepID=A0A7Y3W4A4_9PROT|nr:hypothetical protein [Parvularcula mediterranea]NNU15560.1 hypothetical protein [Parvularcula mediterranea]